MVFMPSPLVPAASEPHAASKEEPAAAAVNRNKDLRSRENEVNALTGTIHS
ncbi:hypothetical protein GCM10012278_71080 [Nonomuraea glycinis]|uniref:Uncharacterized protein n=1 Tax=Nonomuraea glycinis TaxID=2047744 RepID=A0A918ACR7_9ACTN|nr:hypothetical protein GCM10012278_71080 [Nonomuraea glycinis]